MSEPIWLDPRAVLALHDEQLLQHGGGRGVRDAGLLDSALARPRNAFAYGETDPFGLAAAISVGIIANYPFVDGNKRTGFISGVLFLELNGFAFGASEADVVEKVLAVAAGEMAQDAYRDWLEASCHVA